SVLPGTGCPSKLAEAPSISSTGPLPGARPRTDSGRGTRVGAASARVGKRSSSAKSSPFPAAHCSGLAGVSTRGEGAPGWHAPKIRGLVASATPRHRRPKRALARKGVRRGRLGRASAGFMTGAYYTPAGPRGERLAGRRDDAAPGGQVVGQPEGRGSGRGLWVPGL